jgi:molybdopterin-guanine dinucleotide biosynthesis protein A
VLDGVPQVLLAAYRTTAAGPLRAAFDAGERSPRRALERVRVAPVDLPDPAVATDVDTPADLDRYAREHGAGPERGPAGRGAS